MGLDADWDSRIRRRMALAIAVAFGVIAALASWTPGLDQASARWIAGTAFKLSVMVGAIWLAFPQIEKLRKLPGGASILGVAGSLALVVLVRPKMIAYAIPIAVVAMVLLVGLDWASRATNRPKQ